MVKDPFALHGILPCDGLWYRARFTDVCHGRLRKTEIILHSFLGSKLEHELEFHSVDYVHRVISELLPGSFFWNYSWINDTGFGAIISKKDSNPLLTSSTFHFFTLGHLLILYRPVCLSFFSYCLPFSFSVNFRHIHQRNMVENNARRLWIYLLSP